MLKHVIQLPHSIDGFNETDVREEIITPLLHELGYRAGSNANIIREQSLRYPRVFLGRKNPLRDPVLRGRADYILEVNGLVRWTIEAKPPTDPISVDDVEQAYSYACHPEVRAVFFCIVNGAEFRIYQTNQGPGAPPVLTLLQSELPDAVQRLDNVIGPQAILRDHPSVRPDSGVPIGPGLRSVVRIVSGFVEFSDCDPPVPLLAELTLSISDGAIERDEAGHLIAYMHGRTPFRSVNQLNERLGLNRLELVSEEPTLSTRAESPTIFRLQTEVTLPAGATFPNLLGAGDLILQRNLSCNSVTVAAGVLVGNRLGGRFSQFYQYRDIPNLGDTLAINASGRFEAVLA
jgi:hypothetical protein